MVEFRLVEHDLLGEQARHGGDEQHRQRCCTNRAAPRHGKAFGPLRDMSTGLPAAPTMTAV